MKHFMEELKPLFKELDKVDHQLGKDVINEIKTRLVSGHLAKEESRHLQGMRRKAAAGYLGMDEQNYERMLEGKAYQADKEINDKEIIEEFLCMEKLGK